jgi:hypothetical protein
MVSGRPAFPAKDVREIISKKLNNDFDVQNAFPAGIPKTLRHIIKTCCSAILTGVFGHRGPFIGTREAHREITTEHPDAVVREYAADPARVKSVGQMVAVDANCCRGCFTAVTVDAAYLSGVAFSGKPGGNYGSAVLIMLTPVRGCKRITQPEQR